jgi:hypothetical protein
MDRRQALAAGRDLPERARGAALFADVSGFTSLTEMLARVLGPKRGAEELTVHLNGVYDALIALTPGAVASWELTGRLASYLGRYRRIRMGCRQLEEFFQLLVIRFFIFSILKVNFLLD